MTGATPKLMKSARESNSAPNFVTPFSILANLPSSPSIIPASTIARTAASQSETRENLIEVNPAQSETTVSILGIRLLTGSGRRRGDLIILDYQK